MLKDYLDSEIYSSIIKAFNFKDINEIRMRANQNIIIVVKNKKYYLKNDEGEYLIASTNSIENFIMRASEYSVYAYNESISKGYITLPHGIRVGLTGNIVADENKIITIKEFQAINIRIPHFIKNCSLPAYDFLVDSKVKNTLIISPPGIGKTTFIRDFIYQLYTHNVSLNVLVADERNEIASVISGQAQINLGGFCDIYTNCSKTFAFKNGIRSMRPDVIITDELDVDKDAESLKEAMNSGVVVVATIHAKNIKELKNKKGFEALVDNKYFTRYVLLTDSDGPGTISNIFDENLNCIYCK